MVMAARFIAHKRKTGVDITDTDLEKHSGYYMSCDEFLKNYRKTIPGKQSVISPFNFELWMKSLEKIEEYSETAINSIKECLLVADQEVNGYIGSLNFTPIECNPIQITSAPLNVIFHIL